MFKEIKDILADFDPITLDEMDKVKLMDRTDTKYTFRKEELTKFLKVLGEDYKILNVNDNLISRYESLYFDTRNFDLYLKHHSGQLNRHKVRFRKYVESDLHFFEVKFKNNKGRTIKNRIKRKEIPDRIKGKAKKLLIEKTSLDPLQLEPKLWINYSRITMVNKTTCERVTLDLGLNFKNDQKDIHIHPLVIAEVKQDKSSSSPFITLMKSNHVREGSISKYCMGVANLYDSLKKNNFKEKLLNLNKLCYGTNKIGC